MDFYHKPITNFNAKQHTHRIKAALILLQVPCESNYFQEVISVSLIKKAK